MPLQIQEELQTVFLFWFQINIFLLPAEAALVIYINLQQIYIDHFRMWICHLIRPNPFESPYLFVLSLLLLLISHIDHIYKYNCCLDYKSCAFLLYPLDINILVL